ncbi:hypothetical protein SAMN04487914_10193 [Arthrobacter sp. ok909]|nr:hypothetical protein SAMN04487914_10193 [Arthrobacter sp. ok909]
MCCRASAEAMVRLVLRVDDSHWYAVEAGQRHIRAVARIGPVHHEMGIAAWDPSAGSLQLEISCTDAPGAGQPGKNTGPDEVSLGFRQGGQSSTLARLDGRYLSSEVAGGFTGRVIGISVTGGSAVFKRFDYTARRPML